VAFARLETWRWQRHRLKFHVVPCAFRRPVLFGLAAALALGACASNGTRPISYDVRLYLAAGTRSTTKRYENGPRRSSMRSRQHLFGVGAPCPDDERLFLFRCQGIPETISRRSVSCHCTRRPRAPM
jgi:hypothetical protein